MGQIKNIKLHIVTDIKRIKPQKDESQVEEEKSAKVEEKEKKDEREIKVNNINHHGDGKTTNKSNKVTWRPCCCAINLLGRPLADVDAESSLWIMIEIEEFVIHFQNCFLFCLLYISSVVVIHF